MKLYLTHLTKILDKEDSKWRETTILLLDGAPSHLAEETVHHMKSLNLPVMATAPYSYSGCPCELWFSMLKAVNLNVNQHGTGKRVSQNSPSNKFSPFL